MPPKSGFFVPLIGIDIKSKTAKNKITRLRLFNGLKNVNLDHDLASPESFVISCLTDCTKNMLLCHTWMATMMFFPPIRYILFKDT